MVIKAQMRKVNVEELIDKGAPVKADIEKKQKRWKIFNLRISEDMLEQVDKAVEESVGITRTGWVLQAIQEKLKKWVVKLKLNFAIYAKMNW